jgi:lipopolysaccharide transport system permease protein
VNPASPAQPGPGELVLEAGRADAHYWRDLWRYRELLGFLAWRDIKVRYKQAALGAGWALIQPIVTTAIFTFVFGRLAAMPSGGVPYPLLVLSGMLPWQLFATSLGSATNSVVGNSHLISKVYFPRMVVPISSLGVALIDFAIVLGLFAVCSVWFGVMPDWHWVALPLGMLLALLLALGAGLWFTSLTVRFRDFRFIVPFLLQIGIFASPIGFRTDNHPNLRVLLSANPVTGVIDVFRWCLLRGNQEVNPAIVGYSVAASAVLLWTGVWYFRRTERQFADVI